MLNEVPYVVLIYGAVIVGLWISNILYDLNVKQYLSRKIGHFAGGMGFLIAVLVFSTGWWPLILTASFLLALLLARLVKPDMFRGVGGSGRLSSFSEIYFPLAALPVIIVGWLWLARPLTAVACLLFMAWGDGVTGIVRSQVYGRAVKGLWGSAAMLVCCLGIAWAFVHPFWVGAVGAAVATIVEWASGDVGVLKWADDNWTIPVMSCAVVFGLLVATGGL